MHLSIVRRVEIRENVPPWDLICMAFYEDFQNVIISAGPDEWHTFPGPDLILSVFFYA